jgi:hypothetical protein
MKHIKTRQVRVLLLQGLGSIKKFPIPFFAKTEFLRSAVVF